MSLLQVTMGSLFLVVSGWFFRYSSSNNSIEDFLTGVFCAIAGEYFIIATIGRAYIG